jgi:hypothetical protein
MPAHLGTTPSIRSILALIAVTGTLASTGSAAAQVQCGQPGVAAVVDGHAILQEEVDEHLALSRRVATGPMTTEQHAAIVRSITLALVMNHLADAEAARLGLSVTDEELAVNLAMRPLFWDDAGTFSREVYEREVVRTVGTTVEDFEVRIRRDILHGKLSDHVRDAVTDAEVDAWIASHEDVDLGFFSVLGRDAYLEIVVLEILDERLRSQATVEWCDGGADPEMSGPPPSAP